MVWHKSFQDLLNEDIDVIEKLEKLEKDFSSFKTKTELDQARNDEMAKEIMNEKQRRQALERRLAAIEMSRRRTYRTKRDEEDSRSLSTVEKCLKKFTKSECKEYRGPGSLFEAVNNKCSTTVCNKIKKKIKKTNKNVSTNKKEIESNTNQIKATEIDVASNNQKIQEVEGNMSAEIEAVKEDVVTNSEKIQEVEGTMTTELEAVKKDVVTNSEKIQQVEGTTITTDIEAVKKDVASNNQKIQELEETMTAKINTVEEDVVSNGEKIIEVEGAMTSKIEAMKEDMVSNNKKIEEVEGIMTTKIEAMIDNVDTNSIKIQEVEGTISTKIESVENDVATNNMKIQEVKETTKTDVFCGYRNYIGPGSPDMKITYDRVYAEINEINGALDKDTGTFTAGKTGVYEVTVSLTRARTEDNNSVKISLRTTSTRYPDQEDFFLGQYTNNGEVDVTALSASRYMYIQQNEEIFLDYDCYINSKPCYMWNIKLCIAYIGVER